MIFTRFYSILLLAGALISSTMAQAINAGNKSVKEMLHIKDMSFDFGKIQQGHPGVHEFELINTGIDTVKLENVQASCGCTTPVWKKEPVMPGKASIIQVGYNATNEGSFKKPVTIYYNGGQSKIITIKGNVYKSPETSAPVNTSIQLLKQINH